MRAFVSAVLAALSCAAAAPAQVTFRSDVNLATLAVRVTGRGGRVITGLSADDFAVFEDGKLKRIAFFGAENEPASVFVLLDASSSMRSSRYYERAKAALLSLLDALPRGSQAFLSDFSDRIESFSELTADAPGKPFARGPASGGTALYDAVSFALCSLRAARHRRQVLVIATDGADQDSRMRVAELLDIVRSAPAQVFVLGFFNPSRMSRVIPGQRSAILPDGSERDNPAYVFGALARLSGAEVAYPYTEHLLKQAIATIRELLASQYSLSYYLEPSPNAYRKIEVKVKRPGATARTRPGIGVPRSTEAAPSSVRACFVTMKDHPWPYELRTNVGPDGRRTYRDDLTDPASGWPTLKFSYYGADGYHMVRDTPAGGVVHQYGAWWHDFRATVNVSFRGEASPDASAGLAFRVNDNRHFVLGNYAGYYSLLLSADGRMLRLTSTGGPNAGELWSMTVAGELPARIGVECVGPEIRVLWNGRVVGSVADRSRASGKFGLRLTGAGHAILRDLVVEELAPENLIIPR